MKNHLVFVLTILTASICSTSCTPATEIKILGSWRIDSIYDNYNGFSFTNTSPTPQEVYEYREDKSVLRKGMGEQLEYGYQISDSLLTLSDGSGRPGDAFIILHIDNHSLVLKKEKKPIFPGKNQRHYEVRYFSKADSGSSKN